MTNYKLLLVLATYAVIVDVYSITPQEPQPEPDIQTPIPQAPEVRTKRGQELKKENYTTVELTFNWSDPLIKPILTPFQILEKHKGDLSAARRDFKMKSQRKKVKRAYEKLHQKMKEFDASLTIVAGDIKNSFDSMMRELDKSAYTPLLRKIRPLMREIVEDSKVIMKKVGKLTKEVIAEIEQNDALGVLIERTPSKGREPKSILPS